MTILITGASGFIGSFIVAAAIERGFETWAAVRSSSSRAYLKDERIHFIELDLSSEEALCSALEGRQFDYIVHAAGATKCKSSRDFYLVNAEGTRNLLSAIARVGMDVKKFVFLSSLSLFGAIREEQPYEPICSGDTPEPNTHYGKSKLLAEDYLRSTNKINYTILRPTGVYGPREKDYFLMIKSLLRHIDCAVGCSPQRLTFVYVTDLVEAVFLALQSKVSGKTYFISDGEQYDSSEFSRLVRQKLHIRWVLRLPLPIALVRVVCSVCDLFGRLTGRMTALNNDKFHILAQRNWLCENSPAREELGFTPRVTLPEGLSKTIDWYKQEGWI